MTNSTDTLNRLIEILTDAGIRPSIQRLTVLKFLTETKSHPSVDKIYEEVHKVQPTLSRATIYNTVNLFWEKGVIETVAGDNSESRYDYFHQPHAHYQCRVCHQVYDIPYDLDGIERPEGFDIEHTTLIFSGVCPECQADKKQ